MLVKVVNDVCIYDFEQEMFAMDSSADKLLDHLCHMEKVLIFLSSLGGGNSQLHEDVQDRGLRSYSDVGDGRVLTLPYPVMLQIFHPTEATGSPVLLDMCGRDYCLGTITTIPSFIIDVAVGESFRSERRIIKCSEIVETAHFCVLPFG